MSAANHARGRDPVRSFIGVAVVALLLLLATAGIKSFSDLRAAHAHEAALKHRIAETRERIRVLAERMDRIANDPATLERLAREELGMVRPGEVVIVLPAAEPAADG